MATNAEAAELFQGIADILDVLGEKFKPEAYRRAARSIESLTEEVSAVAARDELRTIPGVGDAIEEKLREYLRTGHLEYYDRLRQQVPPGILELLAIPGLGPKTARRFWLELKVETPAELAGAIEKGKLVGVAGFGPKKIEQIRSALASARTTPAAGRFAIEEAYPIAMRLVGSLRELPEVMQCEAAGSFRRRRETVGDLDVLVTAKDRATVFDAFSKLPEVREVRLRGGTKETVILANGLQVDLRVVEPEEFGAALLYFTGSKDHNVLLRSLARDRALKINEYGIFRGEERIGGRTEEEVYSALQLAWIPPELRENRGEIELAAKGPLPALIDAAGLRGDLHVHLLPNPPGRPVSPAAVDELLTTARARRLAYVGFVVGGVDGDGTPFSLPDAVLERLAAADSPQLRVARAVEVDAGGIPAAFADLHPTYVIVRPSKKNPGPPSPSMTPSLGATLVTHAGGETASRPWVAWAHTAGAAIEVGPGTEALDSTGARLARETGTALHVPTGIDRAADDPRAPIALGFARRAAAEPKAVRNAAPAVAITRGWSKRRA
jgi:DNA polymerase/3'-5' exonuclease PolX